MIEIIAFLILATLWYLHDNRKSKIRASLKNEVEAQVREEFEAMYSGTRKPKNR